MATTSSGPNPMISCILNPAEFGQQGGTEGGKNRRHGTARQTSNQTNAQQTTTNFLIAAPSEESPIIAALAHLLALPAF